METKQLNGPGNYRELRETAPDVKNWVKILQQRYKPRFKQWPCIRFLYLRERCQTRLSLSGLLFGIGIEVLANAIRNKNTIKGIKLGDKEIKTSLYADDSTVFVRDLDSIPESLSNLSGSEINARKTEGMWLGSWKGSLETPFGFRWPQDPIT